jgi:uncharacterized protein
MSRIARAVILVLVFPLFLRAQDVSSTARPIVSLAELQQRAETGDAEAQYQLAIRYTSGNGVSKDNLEAVKWFRKSAESGHAMAQVTLGLNCSDGRRGVKEDPAQAVDWFRKAANQGNANGHSELGFMYERGEGVSQDDREAARLTGLAAAQTLPIAQFDLAYMLENGKGIATDLQRAAELYESAAVTIPTARYNLAVMYSKDKSVQKDLVLAYKWVLLDISAEHMRILTGDKVGNRPAAPRLCNPLGEKYCQTNG